MRRMDCEEQWEECSTVMPKSRRPLCLLGLFRPYRLKVETLGRGKDGEDLSFAEGGAGSGQMRGVGIGMLQDRYCLSDAYSLRYKGGTSGQTLTGELLLNHDEELSINGNTVVWSAGYQVRKRIGATTAIVQAKWCRLNSMRQPLLCVLHSDSLITYSPAGEINVVPLQYSVASIWALPSGLLLQRGADSAPLICSDTNLAMESPKPRNRHREGFSENTLGGSGSVISPGALNISGVSSIGRSTTISPAPTTSLSAFFHLQHPLEEPQVVQAEEGGKCRLFSALEDNMVWTSAAVPYVVTYHTCKRQHTVWQVKTAPSNLDSDSLKYSDALETVGNICLQRAWTKKSVQQQASEVILATDDDGVFVLCLLVAESQQLFSFRLHSSEFSTDLSVKPKLEVAWTIPAISAAPIVATRPTLKYREVPCYDILTLSPDGHLSLHVGRYHVCRYYLPLLAVQSLNNTPWGKDLSENNLRDVISSKRDEAQKIVGLRDAVQGRVNVVTDSGKMYRCAVGFTPSAITGLCMSALAEGLRPALYRYLLSRLLEREFPISDALHVATAKGGGRPDLEWAAFSGLITEIIRDMPGEVLAPSKLASHKRVEEKSSWDFLSQSGMHQSNLTNLRYPGLSPTEALGIAETLPLPGQSVLKDIDAETAVYFSVMVEILEVLHAVYEDCKLDTMRWRELWQLAATLSTLAAAAGEMHYVDHYTRDFPMAVPAIPKLLEITSLQIKKRMVPNLYKWLENCLRDKCRANSSEYLPGLLTRVHVTSVKWSRKVIGFYAVLTGGLLKNGHLPSGVKLHIAAGTATSPEQRTVLAMVGEEFGLPDLDRLPPGISLPLRHALDKCREAPPGDWPAHAYVLVGREDLASTHSPNISTLKAGDQGGGISSFGYSTSLNMHTEDVWMAAPYMLHLRPVPILPALSDLNEVRECDDPVAVEGDLLLVDGMEHIFITSSPLRFGRDLRLNEVRRLLGSSKPVAVRISSAPDVSDPDIVNQQQSQLWQLAQRTTGLSLGRGAFTLATSRPMLTEALSIPKLVLAGRLPSQHDATVNLDPNTGNLADVTSWPEFHNGVAAGLRLAPDDAKITRTWIVYNKPDEPNFSHAGLLMALGLHRHLGVLAATDVYRYLSEEHEATTVGVLLGMSAAHRGTMDPGISKMLYLHIPAGHPSSFPELELPTVVQSAALLAVGLLYQGSAHRLTTEILLAEIGRKPGGDSVLDREGYALAAGLALGLVTLGRGTDAWGLADLHIEDRLQHYISGGGEPTDERQRSFAGTMPKSTLNSLSRSFEDQSQLMEGSTVNLDVTAPGATLALGLMFLKTNCEVVAARLAIPDTHFALEYVRPDFILLRLVARSLILWDSVQATVDWIQAQVPGIVKEAMELLPKGAGSPELPFNAEADIEALAQAHVYILAGACLSIGLRYAGTASAEAQQSLRHYAFYFLHEKRAAVSTSSLNIKRHCVDQGALETCLNVAVLSLSLVMAGTGHLETFRLLRFLRRRTDSDGAILFGNHMAISLAIGFLFLGGGGYTFSTNNGAVAALLIALYPSFPKNPNDHRCHLQAFRHLYVLATEARCLQTVDVDTQLPVYIPIEVTLKESALYSETVFSHVTPCILPDQRSLKRVRVCSPRYWPQDIELPAIGQPCWERASEGGPFVGSFLYVKRKVGARSYADDPIGCRSLLSRALHKNGKGSCSELSSKGELSKVDQLVSTFSADPSILAFAQLFCKGAHNSKSNGEFNNFCLRALFESVSCDRPALLQTYLALYTGVETLVDRASGRGTSVNSASSDSLSIQSLKVAVAYCDVFGQNGGGPLVQRTFVAALAKSVDNLLSRYTIFTSHIQSPILKPYISELFSYLDNQQFPSIHAHQFNVGPKRTLLQEMQVRRILFSCFLCWYEIPQPQLVTAALQQMESVLPEFQSTTKAELQTVLPLLALVLPGMPLPALLHINDCLPLLTLKKSK